MDDEFENATVDNSTPSSTFTTSATDADDATVDQMRSCALYLFVMIGIVQLIISVVGLVGELYSHY